MAPWRFLPVSPAPGINRHISHFTLDEKKTNLESAAYTAHETAATRLCFPTTCTIQGTRRKSRHSPDDLTSITSIDDDALLRFFFPSKRSSRSSK
jgi:hypothetical protein